MISPARISAVARRVGNSGSIVRRECVHRKLRSRNRPSGCGHAIRPRRGYTFAELLLVVAVLLVVSGLVFPPVLRMMADQPLKESAERVRSQLANVRIRALDASVAWQFRFEPGGRHFLWMPAELVSAPANSLAKVTTSSGSTSPQFGELPEGIKFCNDLDGIPISVERLSPDLLSGAANSYELQQVGWSQPLVCQPDGTTSDYQLAVVDARNQQIRLSVRGLTGGITVSAIEARRRR